MTALAVVLLSACGPQAGDSPGASASPAGDGATIEFPLGNESNWLEPAYITASLRSMNQLYPTREVARASEPSSLERIGEPFDVRYEFDSQTFSLAEFPARTRTTGLLVIQAGKILHEGYYRGADETSRFLSMAVAKSFTSTLLGIARAEGLIDSFEDPVTDYIAELAGTGYDGVSIKHILQMSSGIDFSEEDADAGSDIDRLADACFGGPERLEDVAVDYGRRYEPGSDFYYTSVDTAILGWLLREVTSRSLSAYMEEKLWQPLGAEADAYWVLDQEGEGGVECALGGFNATLRDYGRFGLLMAYDGVWDDERLLPEGWVAEATIPDSPQVQPGELMDGYQLGYQYQWWAFPDDEHSFVGEGVHGQLLMVNPVLDLVVVKTSDWEAAWETDKEIETWALFAAIADWTRSNSSAD